MAKNKFNYSDLENAYMLALENAKQLYNDASILCNNASYPHAYALFQLSREESGKCLLIQHAILYNALGIQIDYKWLTTMGFANHVSKTRSSLGLENLFISFVERMEFVDFFKLHDELDMVAQNIKQTDIMKNSSLYVGYNGNKFVSPCQVITKEKVNDIDLSAQVCISPAKAIRWTEDGVAKIVDYLRNSTDIERHQMIDCLKAILCNTFKKDEAEKYCNQIDIVLNLSSIGGQ